MNGIKLLLLLMASAQVEPGTERDYGWSYASDGVLEYIVQINPDKKRAMEEKSPAFPDGHESISDMPNELIGRASRVVVRFGNKELPRKPSLQELGQIPRLFEQPGSSATAMLGPGRLQDLEPNVRNIQGQGSAPVFPSLPNGLSNGLSGGQGQAGSLIDDAANALRENTNALRDSLSDQLSSVMPAPSALAQNLPNQLGGASDFLNGARGGAASGKYKDTAPPASATNSATTPQANQPTQPSLPAFPGANSDAAMNNRNPAGSNPSGIGMSTRLENGPLANSGRFNTPPPSTPALNSQSVLPKQQTPTTGFGTSPGLAGRQASDWNTQQPPSYGSNAQQPYENNGLAPNYPPAYTSAPNTGAANSLQYGQGMAQEPSNRIADNSNFFAPPGRQSPAASGGTLVNNNQGQAQQTVTQQGGSQTGVGGQTVGAPTNVDGVLGILFLLSLVVNFYLGILIRKLLIRYRSVLTNVRAQTAYT